MHTSNTRIHCRCETKRDSSCTKVASGRLELAGAATAAASLAGCGEIGCVGADASSAPARRAVVVAGTLEAVPRAELCAEGTGEVGAAGTGAPGLVARGTLAAASVLALTGSVLCVSATFVASIRSPAALAAFGASSLVSATSADSANRSSSSGFSAAKTSSASNVRLRTSLSLNPKGHEQNASTTPITRRRPQRGTATIERAPDFRHASRFTRESVSVSSQLKICAVRKHAPEKDEFRSMRCPRSGQIVPAAARRTISLFSASAMASPSAPVMATARCATSCRTSSSTNCSSASNSAIATGASNPECRAASDLLRRI